jgi:hypothetical protein
MKADEVQVGDELVVNGEVLKAKKIESNDKRVLIRYEDTEVVSICLKTAIVIPAKEAKSAPAPEPEPITCPSASPGSP